MKNKDYNASLIVGILSGRVVFAFTKSYDILQNSNFNFSWKALIPTLFLLIFFLAMVIF